MTTDDVLGRDLAALARDGRERVPPLDSLLAAIEPAPRPPALELLACARRYADRVAWIAGGAAVLGATLVLLAAMLLANHFGDSMEVGPAHPVVSHPVVAWIVGTGTDRVALDIFMLSAITAVIARRIADARFALHLARGRTPEHVADAVDGWALAAKIAGLTALVQLWGTIALATYCGGLWPVFDPGVWYALASTIPLALAALAIARGARRDATWVRALTHLVAPLVALFAFAGAFDVHWQLVNVDGELPLAIDLATRIAATLALLAGFAWYALRSRPRT